MEINLFPSPDVDVERIMFHDKTRRIYAEERWKGRWGNGRASVNLKFVLIESRIVCSCLKETDTFLNVFSLTILWNPIERNELVRFVMRDVLVNENGLDVVYFCE